MVGEASAYVPASLERVVFAVYGADAEQVFARAVAAS